MRGPTAQESSGGVAALGRDGRERFYVRELDGIRFFAFLAVFLLHASSRIPTLPAGGVRWNSLQWWTSSTILAGGFGVDLFFVLSSFLITSLLVRELEGRGRIDVAAFWMRRILRIWPLYYGFVLLCWVFERLPGRMVAGFALFSGNWALLTWPMPHRSAIGPLWSVSVEEQFYLVWPLLLAVLPRRFLRPVCVGMIGLAVGARWVILANGGGIERVWLNTLAHFDSIAVGALIALAGVGGRLKLGLPARVSLGVGAPIVVVVSTGILWHGLLRPSSEAGRLLIIPGSELMASALFLLVALVFGGVILAVLASRGSWLGNPALVYLGRISYGLYVFHIVAIRMVEDWGPWRYLAAFAITLLMASVSFRFLEQPFLRLKERFTYVHSTPSPPAVAETAEES